MKEILNNLLNNLPKSTATSHLFFSPSRINIIGEHIDYNGGKVFPCAINIGTYAAAQTNNLNKLRIKSLNFNDYKEIELPADKYDKKYGWANYPLGVIKYFQEHGYKVEGTDIVIYGNIPDSSGLSSSSSLEVLIGYIFNYLYNDNKISLQELADIGVWTENIYMGLMTGIMDQYAIALGKKDHALLLDTNEKIIEYIPFKLHNSSMIIMNSKKKRELVDSKYNERRNECETSLDIIKKNFPYLSNIQNLVQIPFEKLDTVTKILNSTQQKRVRHVVTENQRVIEAKECMINGDMKRLGNILRDGNESLKKDYEVTGPYLDALVDSANSFKHCLGARMTGAGFGGCAIALVEKGFEEEFQNYVSKEYEQKTGLKPEFYNTSVSDGPCLLK